jgi:hypothetical protein
VKFEDIFYREIERIRSGKVESEQRKRKIILHLLSRFVQDVTLYFSSKRMNIHQIVEEVYAKYREMFLDATVLAEDFGMGQALERVCLKMEEMKTVPSMGPEAAGQRKKALEDALKEASEALKQLKEDAKA